MENGTATLETVWQFPINIYLPYNPAIPLLGIHPREMKPYVPTETYRPMIIEALFIIGNYWKQLKHPSAVNG